MKKVPTIFERDWDGDRSRVLDKINPECQWVFDGEGTESRKLDGTSCLITETGVFMKRREVKEGREMPEDFILAVHDDITGKTVGWVPVKDADKWHLQAFNNTDGLTPGTYELIGKKVQGDPESEFRKYTPGDHVLILHDSLKVWDHAHFERTFDGIQNFLRTNDVEGIVFHHQDGRMGKIKKRDFGFKRL